jgi:hypothetical protein
MDWTVAVAAPLVAAFVIASTADMPMPAGWGEASTGRSREAYAVGLDRGAVWNGRRSLSVRARSPDNEDVDYGFAIQHVDAFGYQGRRVRFSGMLKTTGITGWAGVFMQARPDGGDDFWGGIETGSELPRGSASAKGASDWHPVSVVLDVPLHAGSIELGLALVGNGQVWLSGLKFEAVGDDVPLTAAPVGLDLARIAQRRRERREQRRPEPQQVPANLELRT